MGIERAFRVGRDEINKPLVRPILVSCRESSATSSGVCRTPQNAPAMSMSAPAMVSRRSMRLSAMSMSSESRNVMYLPRPSRGRCCVLR